MLLVITPWSCSTCFVYHRFQMRRSLSILFSLFFALGPLVALFGEDYDARLPACCRRHGAHHCAMSSDAPDRATASNTGPSHFFAAPSRCPLYPHATPAPTSSTHAIATSKITALSFSTQGYVPSEQHLGFSNRLFSNLLVRGPPILASC